jgi:hypothetical protein
MNQASFDWDGPAHLDRVSSRIGAAVLEFCQAHRQFHAGELHPARRTCNRRNRHRRAPTAFSATCGNAGVVNTRVVSRANRCTRWLKSGPRSWRPAFPSRTLRPEVSPQAKQTKGTCEWRNRKTSSR